MDNVNIEHEIKTNKLVSYSLFLDRYHRPAVEAVLLYHLLVSEADRAELT